MAGSSISGLISGMDVDALVTAQLQSSRVPMDNIEKEMQYDSTKKDVLQESIDKLQDFKDTTLDLTLESTFKQKLFNSSDENIISGDASLNAVKGSHSLQVDNIAVPAISVSSSARASLLNSPPNTMNLSGLSGRPDSDFEGSAELDISTGGAGYVAEATYRKVGGGQVGKYAGSVIESVSAAGTVGTTVATAGGGNELQMTVDGDSFTVYLDFALQDETPLKTVAADMEEKVNRTLNEIRGTTDRMYVMVTSEEIDGTGNQGLAVHDLDGSNDSGITFDGGTARTALGLDSVGFSAETAVTDSWTAASLSSLRGELNTERTGFLPGVTLSVSAGSEITTGSASFNVNAELRTLGAVSPSIHGAEDVTNSGVIDTAQTLLSVDFSDDESLTYASDNSAVFTINDTQITIPDVTTATVNDVLAIINSSGAGVTADYDSGKDRFLLYGNDAYPGTSISLGDAGDTTNFLRVSGLSLAHGGTLYPGSATAYVDRKAVLTDSGLTGSPVSGTFTINGTSLYVDAGTDSLDDLIDKINSADTGVIAEYDQNEDKFYLRSDPDSVDTNAEKISVGSADDTSNILEVLNLSRPFSSVIGTAISGNRNTDSVVFQQGASIDETITISAVSGSGAYNTTAYETAWSDGISAGATFSVAVTAGGGGALTGSPFTWTAPSDITSLDDFLTAWNDSANWTDSGGSPASVQVGAVAGDDTSLRFFSCETGASNDFTITEGTVGDAAELGFTSGNTVSSGAGGTATALYNALHFSWNMAGNSNVADTTDITVDGSANINMTSIERGTASLFIISDEATETPTTVTDYFGDAALRSDTETVTGSTGEDARFTVDGIVYERTGNTVSDVLGGVDLQLVSESDSTVTVEIDGNTDPALDAVTDFIFNYNKLLDEFDVAGLSKEDREYLDPLTPDMLDQFSTTSEVDEYEQKHNEVVTRKIMREESAHRSFRDFIRTTINMPVEQSGIMYSTMMDLGIEAGSMGSYEDQKDGYLMRRFDPERETAEEYKKEIREELENDYDFMGKLRENADAVYDFFATDSGEDDDNIYADGVAQRIRDRIDSYILSGGILKEKVKTNGYIDRELAILQEQYDNYEERLELREQTLYNRYNAMEETMARLQQQNTSLTQALGLNQSDE